MITLVGIALLAALGIFAACVAYVIVRFSIPEPHGAIWGLVAWCATLIGTSALILQVAQNHFSIS